MRRFLVPAMVVVSMLAVSACDSYDKPKVGSLTQNLTMIDKTGRIYGSVELDPINGGKVYDADGRLIGRVITPVPAAPAQYAPTVQ